MPTRKSAFSIDPDISKAHTLGKRFYTEDKYFTASKEKIFAKSWQFIGDASTIDGKNNVHPFVLLKDFLNEPLVLTKNKEGKLNCLSNVCTHRGNIVAEKNCHAANLRCRYHGRVFSTEGKFQSMPEFKEVKNFPQKTDDLPAINLFEWKKFLFVSLSKSVKAEKFLAPMMERMGWMPLNKFTFRPDLSKDYTVNAHWALYCENFLEGFHIPFVHAGLNEVIDYGKYKTELFKYGSLQTGIAKENAPCFDLPESSPDYGQKISAYYFFVFPNMMFNFYPWGLSVNIVKPVAADRSIISFLTFVYDESKLSSGTGADLHRVEMEDEEVVQNVQRGIHSRLYKHGRFSVTREQGVHHFQEMIAAAMK